MSGLFDTSSNPAIVLGRNDIEFPEATSGEMTVNRGGMQRVAQALPERAEIVRMGKSYVVRATAGIAPLTALPTTAAAFSIYNGEQDAAQGGISYIIDSVFAIEGVTDATQQNHMSIFGLISKAPVATIPTDTLASTIRNLSGKGGVYGGLARVAAAAAVVDEGWMPIGSSVASNTAFAGALWRITDIPINGLYIVRPKSMFSLHSVKFAATALQVFFGVRYHEKPLDLG